MPLFFDVEASIMVSTEIEGARTMEMKLEYLSFFVVKVDGDGEQSTKTYRHYQTLDEETYLESNLKWFLDGEFMRTLKRKAERIRKSESSPTKIGRFIVENGYALDSNPNYNMFKRLRLAENQKEFQEASDDLLRAYMNTTSIRGGAFIVARAKLTKYFDDPFVFIMKSDFEPKVASIMDEKVLIKEVEMAISAKNIKSIQYPHMPEEGMVEEWELKIFQSSHARYFEDFLKFVDYEPALPEMMNSHVMGIVQEYIEEAYQENEEEKQKESEEMDIWLNKKERELNEKWTHEQVMDAAQSLTEVAPDLEMKFKLDAISVKALLAEYGESIHFAKLGNRYVVLLEGDYFQFEKGVSPIELLRPSQLEDVIQRIIGKNGRREAAAASEDDIPPF